MLIENHHFTDFLQKSYICVLVKISAVAFPWAFLQRHLPLGHLAKERRWRPVSVLQSWRLYSYWPANCLAAHTASVRQVCKWPCDLAGRTQWDLHHISISGSLCCSGSYVGVLELFERQKAHFYVLMAEKTGFLTVLHANAAIRLGLHFNQVQYRIKPVQTCARAHVLFLRQSSIVYI